MKIEKMTMRGPNLSTIAQNFANNHATQWLKNGKYIADIEEFKVLQDGIFYSLWDDNILVAVASLTDDTNEVDNVWVNSDYRGKKDIFNDALVF